MAHLHITGATGYIGGSVLSTLLLSENPIINDLKISVLVRKPEHISLLEQKGLNVILFSGLHDTDAIKKAASEHDIVINTANSYHSQSAEAIIDGLAERQKVTGKSVHLIHTSGTSNLGDRPITGTYTETRVFSDEEDIFAYESYREGLEKYPQRTTDLVVIQNGEATGVKTYILMPPTIYGIGSGFFNRTSIQIDAIMRAAKRQGFTPVIGEGKGHWDHVHIEDLSGLYELVLSRILKGDELPSNRKGIYFCETGNHTWREVSERIAKTGKEAGFLSSDEVREETLENAAKAIEKTLDVAELGFASHSQTRAQLSRKIGWVPKKTRKDFEDSFLKEWKIIGNQD
ncbi:NAD dependent epimerase/dehydratase family protein [Talaromyces proteolyticus]|uniref:NAD dependent epimerase/dehydratase family protein n=1 Tax=Talaromyces proteolyticus TaxID=1131652 RepID=A0AAD4L2G5_9EURO|nr:NAD dependent epimerase/dehydratase family protein [Talaromyces proteolyticus]KAH8705390.1 NAD dependent epimerase/dehydratase family protein [Talaromyces proteolyticus]